MMRKALVISVLVVVYFAVAYAMAPYPTADFYNNFYIATRAVLSGHSPYETIYNSAPWGVIPLIPFALLPPVPAHGLFFATCLYLLVYLAWRMQASPFRVIPAVARPAEGESLFCPGSHSIPRTVSQLLYIYGRTTWLAPFRCGVPCSAG